MDKKNKEGLNFGDILSQANDDKMSFNDIKEDDSKSSDNKSFSSILSGIDDSENTSISTVSSENEIVEEKASFDDIFKKANDKAMLSMISGL